DDGGDTERERAEDDDTIKRTATQEGPRHVFAFNPFFSPLQICELYMRGEFLKNKCVMKALEKWDNFQRVMKALEKLGKFQRL
uniref:Uncharacterized protein n=1 Tax=Cucumis melo TaxID=3656 RepID=A0A9I9D9N5_CUCME